VRRTKLDVLRALLSSAIVLAIAGCGATPFATDPYPMPSGSPRAWVNNPVRIGQEVSTTVVFMMVRGHDSIDFGSAEGIGSLDGADLQFFISQPLFHGDGSKVIGEGMIPLAHSSYVNVSNETGPNQALGIVAVITPRRAGRFELERVKLTNRLNEGPVQTREGIDAIFSVCADDPAPADCPLVLDT
jgi:hypothetical protein